MVFISKKSVDQVRCAIKGMHWETW